MKNVVFLAMVLFIVTMLLFIATETFCQQTNAGRPFTQHDYLIKSKHQKNAGWVSLVAGAAFIGGGLLIGNRKESSFSDAGVGGVIGALGTLSMITSIPLFIASARNKRKAMNVSANVEIGNDAGFHSYPVVSLKLKF